MKPGFLEISDNAGIKGKALLVEAHALPFVSTVHRLYSCPLDDKTPPSGGIFGVVPTSGFEVAKSYCNQQDPEIRGRGTGRR